MLTIDDIRALKRCVIVFLGPPCDPRGGPARSYLASLPEGAELVEVARDERRGGYFLKVRHPSFAATPEGQPYPIYFSS